MPARSLRSLTLSALDNVQRVLHLQQVIEICLEQAENAEAPEKLTRSKIKMLLSLYKPDSGSRLAELLIDLEDIWQLIEQEGDQV